MNSDPLTTAVMVKESMLKPLEMTHSQMNCTPSLNPSPDPSPELLIVSPLMGRRPDYTIFSVDIGVADVTKNSRLF